MNDDFYLFNSTNRRILIVLKILIFNSFSYFSLVDIKQIKHFLF